MTTDDEPRALLALLALCLGLYLATWLAVGPPGAGEAPVVSVVP